MSLGEDGESLNVSAQDGLLSNDDLGADGGQITSFTYTDENGNEQTADAGQTVDTEHGTLTVNSDGSWSFTSDENIDHGDSNVVTDGFTYTITDGDGDTATATQEINITDEGPRISPPSGEPGADGYSVTLDEGNLGDGTMTAGGQALNIDFGADGEGSVALSVPQELQDMNLTAGGEPVTFTVSEDGQSITGSTPDGSPVMTITLSEDNGNYSYSVELSDNLDHTGANGETISDIPVTLTVTDGDGDTASTSLNINVIDDAPEAVDDGTFNVTDGGNTIGTDGGADNLLANDDLGADGAQVTSFTYTDENGETQTADAGSTVDTEQGTLTVNADGTWSFESDDRIESADGSPVMDNFTYTITDGDGDTSTANVTINVSDGTAEPPELVVGDAIGYEDNAIPINISTSLTDTDGSESLSITISGVPEGATLSAGTDNGDGTWTLEESDLDGLTVTPPTDSDVDFDLSVSVTSTETSTGETSTVTDTFTVEVDAVADPTTVSATVEAKLVGGEQVTETVSGEGSIDASNFNQPGHGFTVSARTLNADGSLSDASSDNVTSQSGGLGVKGNASAGEPDAQLGFNPETETSEQLVIDFDHDVTELSFTVSRLFANEGDGVGDASGNEQGRWQVFDDGELVAEGTFDNDSGNEGTFSIDLPDGVSFNQIVFSATEYSGGDGDQTQDSSDYFIKDIDFSYQDTVVVEETEPQCEVTVNVDATFGDFTDGSENHFIVVEVPEGWEPQGEYVEVDSSNYGEGHFIAIPVDAADLQASGGSISVPVSFLAPAPDADESVDLDVFAVAQEVNIDGTVGDGEITLDNNNTMSKATVTVDHKDVVVEDPTLEAEDAQGYEDNAIALDIDAGLTDTDGSESLSITISGVPEGAMLSAGTDNGDGTWTLEEGDLDGLTITPPADSDADFELSVSATSTESSTGESKTINTTIDVKVDAVADDTTVSGVAETDGIGGGDHAVTVNLNATFGDYEDGSESHFVLVEIPDGWEAPEGSTVVDGGDFDSLPDKQFVKVEVDNADLADSGGSAQVSVTFQVPDDQASGEINFDVFSGAAENPGDGEITLDNNTSFSGTQVAASYQDGAPTVEAGEVRLDENDLGGGSTSATGNINIDFGADGEGTVTIGVPAELEDMGLTSGGEPITFTVSEDGQSITGSTPDGAPVLTITLNEAGGDYSYTVEMQAPLDHSGENGDLIDDMPVTLTVTDGNGESTETTLNIDIADAVPEAVDDGTFNVADGGNTIGTDGGADNLLANDDLGADGAQVTSFTYTDENGETQTAQAGETVDTEQGTLTVNADGTWSFESDEQMESADGQPVMDNFTYTITDGDGDTSTANVTINVTDGTAQEPELVVGDAVGYEDNAIPLNIDASLRDTDGSESLSITISGVPNGATLSAGTDNGDGSWTLEEGDLDGLTVTPPADSDVDFDLSVSVTSTEASTGDTNTVETTFTVEVDAVADPTTVSATVETTIVEGEPAPETGDITVTNSGHEEAGFHNTYGYYIKDEDGNPTEGKIIFADTKDTIGDSYTIEDVDPDRVGFFVLPNGDNVNQDLSNGMDVTFEQDESGNWHVVNAETGETLVGDGSYQQAGNQDSLFFSDNNLNADGMDHVEDTSTVGNQNWEDLMKTATGQDNDYDDVNMQVDFKPDSGEATEPHCEITVNVDATFGDYSDGSENHFVVVQVPEGWEPQGEFVQVDSSNYGEGNFIAIPVDAADLQASGGSVSVPVTFVAPVPEDDGSVSVNVFAVAQEVNIDGTVGDGEITLDNNNTMSQATVEVENKDMQVEEPTLEVTDAEGYEDNAIALNINADLGDTDGSETMSVTISGVPQGAMLSAGTDNGDGTWTLEEGDLDGLTVTPPADSDVDFDLTVSVTSTESSTGETSTVEQTFTVEVDAVADDVGVSAEIKTTIVPGEGGDTEPETVTIGADNYDEGDSGFTVSGRTLDRHGNLSEGSTDNISVKSSGHPTGFGVKGDASNGADSEIGYEDGKSEQVVIDFDSDVSQANVTIAWQNPNEDCRITLYRDGEPVGEVVIEGGTDGVDSLGVFKADDGGSFDQMVFEAVGDNSDFLVHEVSFEIAPPEPDPVCEVEIDVTASFGDYEDGSEQHFVFVEVPEGMTPTDENAQTVEGNAANGLTEGKTFVVVEVDAADIEAGGGTVTVPVSFTGPVPEDGGSVTANVFAGAQETNLDGGELTFDNNLKLASTSVESEKGDMTVSDPDMDLGDAAGLEDTAIHLDLNISLTDTDGSESMSITISDVPQGATLSAGTDNGDGTWTLEEGDLDGLTITPPHDSDVDFDLKVEVAVTESSTGETKTFSEDVKVTVEADADAPTLDASLSVNDDGATASGGDGGKGSHANNGFGNGDQTAPGNSNYNNNAENAGGDGTSANNDFVDDGSQNHHGTGGDDNFIVDRDLNMNENFNMGNGDDTVTVNGDTSQGHNFNMGAGDDSLTLNGDINGNTAMDGGSGNDVLYLEGDSDQYTLQNFTNNQGHINTQIIDNSTGQTITVNNVEAISFGDGEVVGNADLVDRDQDGNDTGGEPSATVYDLDIDSALSDIDGSESLSITLGPVPEGVSFSAGTDNGDGTWSLEPEDLQDLQMTVEAEVNADFDLPIKATSTEAENGDSESVNMSLKVELPEDHGDPVEPPVNNDGNSGHGSGQGTGGGKSASGHGTGGASKVGKSGSGHGKGNSGSGDGKSGSGHGHGGHSKTASSGSGHGKGGHSKHGHSGSGHGRGGHSAKGGHSRGGSGHGRGGHSGHGNSGHGRGWGGSGHGHSGHGKGWGGSGHGHGSGQGIAAAGGSGHGGPQGNNGFGNGDQDAPGGSADHNNAENAGGGDGDRLMAALEKFSNASPPTEDGGGDTFRNVGAGRGNGGSDGNWFDEQQEAPADDDVFGKTEMEQKEEDDQKAEEAQREEEESGIQIPADDNGGPEADFEDRSLV
ncbi:MAG: cadherin-like domain-containing protein [Oricola sp.]|nr:cadherin-like domain-containing protein [Oricola sp.]